MLRWLLFSGVLTLIAAGAQARDVIVFAAASLAEPIEALAEEGSSAVVSPGGSGALARQVSQGAPASIVVLAHPQWMDWLEDRGHLSPGSRTTIAGNELVLVGRETSAIALTPQNLSMVLADGRLAMGFANSVPAGIYGREAFETLGLWESVSDRLAETDNVRAALALASRGEVPLALVYATDARVAPNVTVRARIPGSSHTPILYEAAIVAGRDDPAVRTFFEALTGEAGRKHLSAAGFRPVEAMQ